MKTFFQFLSEGNDSTLENAKGIVKTLRLAGYQAYLVGGCVRDTLLGHHPKDYDVATDAHPEQVIELYPDADKIGAHFGVVLVNGTEIATFRSDSVDSDGRRPTHVTYEKSPKADASRRDFTCNAMFLDPFTGHILDFYNGQEDIKNKVLRAVGDPHKRFQEDHLRMMRAIRFAARLGFTIEPETYAAMSGQASHIKDIAIERTTQELTKALTHDAGSTILTMKATGLLSHVIPELETNHQAFLLTMDLLDGLHKPSSEFALATLFCQLDLKTVDRVGKRLKLSNEELGYVLSVLQLQPRITLSGIQSTMDVLKKLMRDKFFEDSLKLYDLRLRKGDPLTHSGSFHVISKLFATMTHEDLNPARFVTGDDLIALGMKPGKSFKDILDAVEIGQLTGKITSKHQAMELVQTGRILHI